MRRKPRPLRLLTPEGLADKFARYEQKDLRVAVVRVRAIPSSFNELCTREGECLLLWGAQVILDPTLKAGQMKLRVERSLEPITPKRFRTLKVAI